MFIGHFAAGFAAKKLVPGVSLGWLFLAAQFIDLLWPTLLLDAVVHQPDLPLYPGTATMVGMNAWVGHAQWLLVLWGYWVDNHRRPATRP